MKIKWLVFFFAVYAFLGYFREFFFVHLNIIMYQKYYNSVPAPALPDVMAIFESQSYSTLYYSKYIYTLVWTTLYFITGFFAIKKLTGNAYLIRIFAYSYCALCLLAMFSMAYGYFVNNRLQDDEYTLSRWLLGIAQSPIICLILVASEKLYNKSFQS